MSRFDARTAAAVVIANMVGTGVFTSLGFQLLEIDSGFVLLMLWAVGGVAALCGAMCYAELGAALPGSGGEYHFLSEIYHPAAGFISGWISATVGFAAPTALAALTFGSYLGSAFPGLPATLLATLLIIGLCIAHSGSHQRSGLAQSMLTALKLLLIVGFCSIALWRADNPQPVDFAPGAGDGDLLLGGAFAISLIYVNYAFSGWNAATYISGELEQPQRTLPWVLLGSTLLVGLLYLLLNAVFLWVAPMEAMRGKVEVGFVAAGFVFGESGAALMGCLMALLLVSTVSAMILAGPRVLHRIGEDIPAFRALGTLNQHGIPQRAVLLQGAISLFMLWTASFERILVFSGAIMALNTLFAVAGLFLLRWRAPTLARPYRVSLYPLPPLLFLLITGWTLFYTLAQRPIEGALCIAIVASGAAFYWLSLRLGPQRGNTTHEL
ncbi:MAG: amino acid permease [Halieaceae bacterium]|nr:amino acid permease [Halieaceae bacterium]